MLRSDQRAYPLAGTATLIGRDVSNDICIESNLVSRFHAKILTEDKILIDLQSRNGTYVNDRKVHNQHAQISIGDAIRFGDYPEVFYYTEGANDMQRTVVHQTPVQECAGQPEEPESRQSGSAGAVTLLHTADENLAKSSSLLSRCQMLGKSGINIGGARNSNYPPLEGRQKCIEQQETRKHAFANIERTEKELAQAQRKISRLEAQIRDQKADLEQAKRHIKQALEALGNFANFQPHCDQSLLEQAIVKLRAEQRAARQKAEAALQQMRDTNTYYLEMQHLRQEICKLQQLCTLGGAFADLKDIFNTHDREPTLKAMSQEIVRLKVENEFLRNKNRQLLANSDSALEFDLLAWHDQLVDLSHRLGKFATEERRPPDESYDAVLAMAVCFQGKRETAL